MMNESKMTRLRKNSAIYTQIDKEREKKSQRESYILIGFVNRKSLVEQRKKNSNLDQLEHETKKTTSPWINNRRY